MDDIFNEDLEVILGEEPFDETEYVAIEDLVQCERLKKLIKDDVQTEMKIVDLIDNFEIDDDFLPAD
mgnify:CR=1 FL=1